MIAASFADQVKAIADNTKIRVDTLWRRTVFDMFSRAIMRSPVRTGRFRGNWQLGVGGINTDVNTTDDPGPVTQDGSGSSKRKSAIQAELNTADLRDTVVYLSNNMNYAYVLEYGRPDGRPGSQQAPGGMIRITVAEFEAALTAQANFVKGMR